MTVSLCELLVTLISVIEEEDDLLIVKGLEEKKALTRLGGTGD